MLSATFLRRLLHQSPPLSATARGVASLHRFSSSAVDEAPVEDQRRDGKARGRWVTLPPFDHSRIDGAALGREIVSRREEASSGGGGTTALKWVLRCCPDLPRNLVQKLFRLRQVSFKTHSVKSGFIVVVCCVIDVLCEGLIINQLIWLLQNKGKMNGSLLNLTTFWYLLALTIIWTITPEIPKLPLVEPQLNPVQLGKLSTFGDPEKKTAREFLWEKMG